MRSPISAIVERILPIMVVLAAAIYVNKLLSGGRMPNGRLIGYIRDYQASTPYALRAISQNGVSTKEIPIASLAHRTQ
jgi:hypothetical protein